MTLNVLRTMLTDQVDRIEELFVDLTDGLTERAARYQIDGASNTINWLLWHSGRVIDAQLFDITGGDELWADWAPKFALPLADDELGPGQVGFAQDPRQAAKVVAASELLRDYGLASCAALREFLATVDENGLTRIIDRSFEPPVTVSARVVSIIGDCLQHLGQAAYVRGVAERAGN